MAKLHIQFILDPLTIASHFLPEYDGISLTELALEVLRRAQTPELSVHHDGQPRAQSLTLLHAEDEKERNLTDRYFPLATRESRLEGSSYIP